MSRGGRKPLLGPLGSIALGAVLIVMALTGSLTELAIRLLLAWAASAAAGWALASPAKAGTPDVGLGQIAATCIGVAVFIHPVLLPLVGLGATVVWWLKD